MPFYKKTDLWPNEEDHSWRPIPGFENYEVSNFGNVRSIDRLVNTGILHSEKRLCKGVFLKPSLSQQGYYRIYLYHNDSRRKYPVHRLVALAFIPNPNNKSFINHLNGIKSDNRVTNLEWCTIKENVAHAIKMGLSSVRGSGNGMAKINEEQVLAIRQDHKDGLTLSAIVAKHDTPYHATHRVIKNKNWKHLI